MNKTEIFKSWWKECLKQGRQLDDELMSVHGVQVPLGSMWKNKIETELLWLQFQKWLLNGPYADFKFNKSGFMLIFYKVTGAKKGRSRQGQPNRQLVYVSLFRSLREHKAHLIGEEIDWDKEPETV